MRVDIYAQREGLITVARQKKEVDISVSLSSRRRAMRAADRLCITAVVLAVIWFVLTILPAFFDGRVAQAVR